MATQSPFSQGIFPPAMTQPATQGLPLSMSDPDMLKQQYQIQQNQQIAQLLMQQGAQGTPEGTMVSGHYVKPNGAQGMANALKLYLGMKGAEDIPQQQMQLAQAQDARLQGAFGLGQPRAPQAPQAPAAGQPTTSQAMPDPGAAPQAFPMGGPGQPTPAAQAQPAGIPPLPGRTPQESFQIARTVGIPKYMELLAAQGAPSDLQKNAQGAGMVPGSPQYQAAMAGAVGKAGYIAPTTVAPGGALVPAGASMPSYIAPKDGIQMGPNGASEVPGYSGANANIAGAQTRAQAAGTASQDLVKVPDAAGTERYRTREDVASDASRGGNPVAAVNTKLRDADQMSTLISQAEGYLPKSSNGVVSSALTRAGEVFGSSGEKSKADAQLRVVAGQLVMKMPRMEGPQSDADRQLYQQMAGDLANPNSPIETRRAALKTIQSLNDKYLQANGGTPSQNAGGGRPSLDSIFGK